MMQRAAPLERKKYMTGPERKVRALNGIVFPPSSPWFFASAVAHHTLGNFGTVTQMGMSVTAHKSDVLLVSQRL